MIPETNANKTKTVGTKYDIDHLLNSLFMMIIIKK